MLQSLCCAGDPPPGPLRRRGRSRCCWSSEKSELQYETLMYIRADFSVSNNNQKLQIASPSPRQAQCKLRLRETLMVKALSPRQNRLTRLTLFNAGDSERTMEILIVYTTHPLTPSQEGEIKQKARDYCRGLCCTTSLDIENTNQVQFLILNS